MADGAPMRLVTPIPADDDAVTMAQGRSRPAWAEIDLAAVAHNAAVLARARRAGRALRGGQGPRLRARRAGGGPGGAGRGAQRLAVALVDEGVELREHGVTAPVLLLSECGADAVDTALAYGLTPTLYSTEGIRGLRARRPGSPAGHVAVHVKVDTGMHRVGAAPEDLVAIAAAVGARAHAGARGRVDAPARRRRRAGRGPRLHRGSARPLRPPRRRPGRRRHRRAPVLHAANTAGAVAFTRSRYDMVRCGLASTATCRSPHGATRPSRAVRWRRAATRHGAQGAGGRGPHARGRGAPLLRPAAAAAAALGGRHRARSATPTACRGPCSARATRCSSEGCAGRWRGW